MRSKTQQMSSFEEASALAAGLKLVPSPKPQSVTKIPEGVNFDEIPLKEAGDGAQPLSHIFDIIKHEGPPITLDGVGVF